MFACAGPETRRDDFLMSHLDLLRVGRVLLGAGYAFHDNRSNSYGETVLRHIATARFAAPLPGGFTLAARGEVLLAFYSQPMIVGQRVAAGNTFSSVESIDDENRSSVRVDLSPRFRRRSATPGALHLLRQRDRQRRADQLPAPDAVAVGDRRAREVTAQQHKTKRRAGEPRLAVCWNVR